ncbi:lipolytic protein G-D-S-L family [Halogeometricum pallidum JCM 14848]|uniref:Lipolytic protein G-D-S-L family n=1 Tax=Halogeometricum pallidum JCM 14848 TaxID=1227487 RepID=M0D1N6_HALPD|nr:SGNH/GDSL hydrolase family protein [Halogeometricum pallidum]ELZ28044.1 lipolytic protein G-D-S-L family [Halogeometricum pallidum JCM 14848]
MEYDDVSLHNVGEVRAVDGVDGQRIQRVPESVRRSLNEKARDVMYRPAGAEIRFVPTEGSVDVTLSSPDGACDVVPFWGPFMDSEHRRLGTEPETFTFETPERPAQLDPEAFAFSPAVCRLALWGGSVVLHGIDGGRRPPEPSELPERRYLAYGTSITFGSNATGVNLSYPWRLAESLDADVVNLGCPGSAFCEPELADYAAGLDYDVATLALSVNMLAAGFSTETFRERARYFVETVAEGAPDAAVAAITLFPFSADLVAEHGEDEMASTPGAYRRALREIAADAPGNVTPVEGTDLLGAEGLTTDLVHPSDRGMGQIADGLARHFGVE